jgi:excisionase family DNA binding protein
MFLTIPEAAHRLGMHADTVRRMIKDGELAAVKGPHVNSPYRISEETIEAWIADFAARPAS